MNRLPEPEFCDKRFDFWTSAAFSDQCEMNVRPIQDVKRLNDIAVPLVACKFGDHGDEFIARPKMEFLANPLDIGRRNAFRRELFKIDTDAGQVEEAFGRDEFHAARHRLIAGRDHDKITRPTTHDALENFEGEVCVGKAARMKEKTMRSIDGFEAARAAEILRVLESDKGTDRRVDMDEIDVFVIH